MTNALAKSASIIIVLTLLGRLLGLIRDSFIASTYGLSYEADVYNWIFGIILTLYMIIPGAINAVYVPVISQYLAEQHIEKRNKIFQGLFTAILMLFVIATIGLYIFTPQIIAFLQPGYDSESLALGIELFRIALPAMFAMGLIGLFMSVSYSHKQFFLPSFGTVIFSLSVIFTIIFFVPHYGIHGLMIGTVFGYVLFAILLFVQTKRKNYHFHISLEAVRDRDIKRMGELLVPILLASTISQSYFYVNQALASMLEEGAQSALIYAYKIFLIPSGVFVGAFTVPLLPIISELVKKNQIDETKRILRKGTAYMHLLMFPTMIAFIVIGDEIIRFVFERGVFSPEDTARTYQALIFYSIALFPLAARDIVTRVYYSMENTKTPMFIGLFAVIVNFIVAFLLMDTLNLSAMTIGFSAASLFNLWLLVVLLKRKIGKIYDKQYYISFGKSIIASASMGAVLWGLKQYLQTAASVFVLVPIYIVIGGIVYYFILVLLREEHAKEIRENIWKKIKRK